MEEGLATAVLGPGVVAVLRLALGGLLLESHMLVPLLQLKLLDAYPLGLRLPQLIMSGAQSRVIRP